MADVDSLLARLAALHPRIIDLSLDRITALLAALGHPERRLPPVVHVAGTNGKGSTIAFCRAGLEAAGYRVHVYTSPHLVRFNERIVLGGETIADQPLAALLERVEAANAGAPMTFFEITTAAAFLAFAEAPADILLLEVGLGGRLDATNLVARPALTCITPVALDHQKYLGDGLAAIAAEKAGILKRGSPGIIGPQTDAALDVIEAVAARRGAPLFIANRDWVAYAERGHLVYQDEDGLLDLPSPRLAGRHQFTNAGTAIAALRRAGFGLPSAAIEAGLLGVDWPARLQRLTAGALVERAPENAEVWLDGGHNPGAGIVIAEAMADLEERAPRPLHLIAGMLNTKDPAGFFRPFSGLARRVHAVPVPFSAAGRDPVELATIAGEVGLPTAVAGNVAEAIAEIAAESDPANPPRILICGSLYLAGAVLAENGTPPR